MGKVYLVYIRENRQLMKRNKVIIFIIVLSFRKTFQ